MYVRTLACLLIFCLVLRFFPQNVIVENIVKDEVKEKKSFATETVAMSSDITAITPLSDVMTKNIKHDDTISNTTTVTMVKQKIVSSIQPMGRDVVLHPSKPHTDAAPTCGDAVLHSSKPLIDIAPQQITLPNLPGSAAGPSLIKQDGSLSMPDGAVADNQSLASSQNQTVVYEQSQNAQPSQNLYITPNSNLQQLLEQQKQASVPASSASVIRPPTVSVDGLFLVNIPAGGSMNNILQIQPLQPMADRSQRISIQVDQNSALPAPSQQSQVGALQQTFNTQVPQVPTPQTRPGAETYQTVPMSYLLPGTNTFTPQGVNELAIGGLKAITIPQQAAVRQYQQPTQQYQASIQQYQAPSPQLYSSMSQYSSGTTIQHVSVQPTTSRVQTYQASVLQQPPDSPIVHPQYMNNPQQQVVNIPGQLPQASVQMATYQPQTTPPQLMQPQYESQTRIEPVTIDPQQYQPSGAVINIVPK